jgi:hypothetical protein
MCKEDSLRGRGKKRKGKGTSGHEHREVLRPVHKQGRARVGWKSEILDSDEGLDEVVQTRSFHSFIPFIDRGVMFQI